MAPKLTDEWVHAIANSRIATLELTPSLFAPEDAPLNRPALKKLLASTDITISSLHASYGNDIDLSRLEADVHGRAVAAYRNAIALAVEFGAPIIVTHMGQGTIPEDKRSERIEQGRRSLAELAEPCGKAGVRVAVEILNGDTTMGNAIDELLSLIDGLDERTFGLCLDVNHVRGRYVELPDIVRGLGRRMTTMHISDFDGVAEKHWFPGKGVIPWKALMDALREIDYAGPFNYEALPEGETPEERIAGYERNFDWLRGLQEAVA